MLRFPPGAPDNLTSETGSVEIVRVSAHDPDAFTQGLEIDGNRLYESTGRVGQSWVRSSEISDEQSPPLRDRKLRVPISTRRCSVRASRLPETHCGNSPGKTALPSPVTRTP